MRKAMKRLMAAATVGLAFCALAAPAKKVKVDKSRILIAYYSWSGNTRAAAESIARLTGGTLFEIRPAKPYPKEYRACANQARKEIRDKVYPELETRPDLSGFDVIFVGSPNWWGTMAPPVAAFLADGALRGRTVVPFFTHGGGGMMNCEKDAQRLLKNSRVLKARTLHGDMAKTSEKDLARWIGSLLEITGR